MTEGAQPGAPRSGTAEREAVADREPRLEARARVLVVEDEHELRELIARWLETKGYFVVEAADGKDAVDLLEAGLEPDVILLDLSLPRMDGASFLAWMREQPKHAHRRVIVASAYLDDLPHVDADRTFAKPFRPERLAAELERLTSD
jgi:two-component system, chemotaxis family, chemotaxis protein CheY